MSNHRPGTKGYLKTHVEKRRGKDETILLVGAEDKSSDYRGPVAEVTWDDTWLYICTDHYEGNAMLNIEALPYLRKALARIARLKKSVADGQSANGKGET